MCEYKDDILGSVFFYMCMLVAHFKSPHFKRKRQISLSGSTAPPRSLVILAVSEAAKPTSVKSFLINCTGQGLCLRKGSNCWNRT